MSDTKDGALARELNEKSEVEAKTQEITSAMKAGNREQARALFAEEYLALNDRDFSRLCIGVDSRTWGVPKRHVYFSRDKDRKYVNKISVADGDIFDTTLLKMGFAKSEQRPLANSALEGAALKFNELLQNQATSGDATIVGNALIKYSQRLDKKDARLVLDRAAEISTEEFEKHDTPPLPRLSLVFRDDADGRPDLERATMSIPGYKATSLLTGTYMLRTIEIYKSH